MRILVHIATRGRGFDWLAEWIDRASHFYPDDTNDHLTRFTISLDEDDQQKIPRWVSVHAKILRGAAFGKIAAMNRGISEMDWDLLIVGSDDMEPVRTGYDQILADAMQSHFPDLDGCLWTPTEDASGHTREGRKIRRNGDAAYLKGWICMLPIMGRKYYDRFGYVYHPSYKSFWCDNEQTEVARRLGKIKYIDQQLFNHNHPEWYGEGVVEYDRTYNQASADNTYQIDMRNYQNRKRHGFPK